MSVNEAQTDPTAAHAPDRAVSSAKIAVFAVFALNGFNFANWASRIPALRDDLTLSAAQVGLLLLVGSIGSLVALPFVGLVVQRLGARHTVASYSSRANPSANAGDS